MERLRLTGPSVAFVTTLLVLSLFGVAMIYSAGLVEAPTASVEGTWMRQATILVASLGLFAAAIRVQGRWYEWAAAPAYVFWVAVLLLTLLIGTGPGPAGSVKSFLSVGGFRFQPAEAAKVTTLLLLAKYLGNRETPPQYLQDLATPVALVGLPLVAVLLQPDLGTAAAFVGILFSVLFWAGTPIYLLFLVASPGIGLILAFNVWAWSAYIVLLGVFAFFHRFRLYVFESVAVILANVTAGAIAQPLWNSLAEYQKNRIRVFFDPFHDPLGAGWQIIQSKVAVGSGGLLGKGFAEGTQKRLNFLPEQHTDFVFSVVGEEFGFLGTSLVIAAFAYLFMTILRLAESARSDFAMLFVVGTLGAWLTHVFVNVGMTVGIVPITGIPLPFISYGGSFLLMSWLAAAIAIRLASEDS